MNHHAHSGLVIAGGPAVASPGALPELPASAVAPVLRAMLDGAARWPVAGRSA
jgi:hypothetical protein